MTTGKWYIGLYVLRLEFLSW